MRRLMLDTNICIHAIKRNAPEVVRRLERTSHEDVAISSVVAAELWTGVMKSRERGRNEQALREFLAFVDVRDFPAEAARAYGEAVAFLQSPPADCAILHVAPASALATWRFGLTRTTFHARPSFSSSRMTSAEGSTSKRRSPWKAEVGKA